MKINHSMTKYKYYGECNEKNSIDRSMYKMKSDTFFHHCLTFKQIDEAAFRISAENYDSQRVRMGHYRFKSVYLWLPVVRV